MRDSVQRLPKNATQPTEQLSGGFRTTVRSIFSVAQVARRLWAEKTARQLALRADVSLRTAEYWLAGEREMGAEAFVALLRSDDGFAFLEAVMTAVPQPAQPAWWRRLSRNAGRAEIRRRQAALAAEIERIEAEEQLDLQLKLGGPRG